MFSPFLEKASKRGYDTIFKIIITMVRVIMTTIIKKIIGIMCKNNVPKYIKLLQKNSTDVME
jgi:hypothetical protein